MAGCEAAGDRGARQVNDSVDTREQIRGWIRRVPLPLAGGPWVTTHQLHYLVTMVGQSLGECRADES